MNRFFMAMISLATLLLVDGASAHQARWRQITIGGTSDSPPIVVALYYPTQAPSQAIAMGPFTLQVAVQGPPEATVKGLIVLSHGTGGSELAHSRLAEALARDGYLVAALRHPGDNWQDRSLLKDRSGAYFSERPRQVTRVIDALLSDPQWSERIAKDASGPRIGAVGHSAGGYTVLALGGGAPDLSRIASHCSAEPGKGTGDRCAGPSTEHLAGRRSSSGGGCAGSFRRGLYRSVFGQDTNSRRSLRSRKRSISRAWVPCRMGRAQRAGSPDAPGTERLAFRLRGSAHHGDRKRRRRHRRRPIGL
jgi:predicted dienelactone hydrolase